MHNVRSRKEAPASPASHAVPSGHRSSPTIFSVDRTPDYVTKKDLVAGRLREMILSGELAPGTKITQQLLIDRLTVSSSPVREAIRELESEGYLECPPHHGAYVATGSTQDLDEVYSLRSYVEAKLAARAAANMTREDLERIRSSAKAYALASRRGDAVSARRLNYQFHRTIWELARQPISLRIARSLYAKLPWETFTYESTKLQRSVPEHEAIIKAFERRNAASVEKAMAGHVLEQWERQRRDGSTENRRAAAQ